MDVETVAINDHSRSEVIDLVQRIRPTMVFVGSEFALQNGVADAVRSIGVDCVGCSAEASKIESSKSYGKSLMKANGIPTPNFEVCEGTTEVLNALNRFGPPYVVKADGFALGKGVLVTDDLASARHHANEFGRVVIEEYRSGSELSVMGLVSGRTFVALPPARDYKRAYDGDRGPNTGGMGSFATSGEVSIGQCEEWARELLEPTLRHLESLGIRYQGVVYLGLVVDQHRAQLLEYNVRFGDPEALVVLPLVGNVAELLEATARGELEGMRAAVRPDRAAVSILVAAEGYPASSVRGRTIHIDNSQIDADRYVLHSNTVWAPGIPTEMINSGGRIMNAVGLGSSLEEARAKAYEMVGCIQVHGSYYRNDIALEVSRRSISARETDV